MNKRDAEKLKTTLLDEGYYCDLVDSGLFVYKDALEKAIDTLAVEREPVQTDANMLEEIMRANIEKDGEEGPIYGFHAAADAIIDSLAVEREPVKTDAIIKALQMCEDEIRDYNDRALPHNINEALDAAYSQLKQLEALKARNT